MVISAIEIISDITENKKAEEVKVKQLNEREIWVGKNRVYLGDDNILNITGFCRILDI